jgi:GABA(A) receptor-associated protein
MKDNNLLKSEFRESDKIREKYPDKFPIVVKKSENSSLQKLDKSKYLVPGDLTVGQFQYVIRKKLTLRPEQAIFLFCKNTLPNTAEIISSLYDRLKDEDGFLYMIYCEESTFG